MEIEINGAEFVEVICKRLKEEKILLYDSNIVREIEKLSIDELKQIITKRMKK